MFPDNMYSDNLNAQLQLMIIHDLDFFKYQINAVSMNIILLFKLKHKRNLILLIKNYDSGN